MHNNGTKSTTVYSEYINHKNRINIEVSKSYNIEHLVEDSPQTVIVETKKLYETNVDNVDDKYKNAIKRLLNSDDFRSLEMEKHKKVIFHNKRCQKVLEVNNQDYSYDTSVFFDIGNFVDGENDF